LNYQGDDLSTSLLERNIGQILNINGLYYFYIYGANCYGANGLDKKSFDERYE
jgi:DNA-directed RNA polymerase